ncbi:MAG: hypothetical protein HKM07_02495 [Chlamydiae bacterium]|nr:hypothetical protein [Chlamydiota bacterium]
MRFIIICGMILTLFSACLGYCSKAGSGNYEQIADAITAETAKKLQKEKGLILAGTGGKMMADIQMMMMSFDYYHVVNLQTARKLIASTVQEYLSAINANEKIRPYLHEYPFTVKNVEISIVFFTPDGSDVALNEITIASLNQGLITYYVDTPDKIKLKILHTETYEEALKLDQK